MLESAPYMYVKKEEVVCCISHLARLVELL